MNLRPRHLLIRLALPFAWRSGKSQQARILLEFADTELDSAWQSLYALERVSDQRLRGLLFEHAFEELFHSDLFLMEALSKAPVLPSRAVSRRVPLLDLTRSARRRAVEFFAFLAIGESEIQYDFGVYERAIPDDGVRALFRSIRRDEECHARDSGSALRDLARAGGVSLGWLRLRHLGALAYKRYIQVMTRFGALPMTAVLCVSYAVFGGPFARQARARLALGRDRQLEMLRHQQVSLERALGKPG